MTNNQTTMVSSKSRTSEDILWDICARVLELVNMKFVQMRLNDKPQEIIDLYADKVIDLFASDIYESYGDDPELRELLCALQGGQPAPCSESVYLSGLRDSLRLIKNAGDMFPGLSLPARVEAYRDHLKGPVPEVITRSSMRDFIPVT